MTTNKRLHAVVRFTCGVVDAVNLWEPRIDREIIMQLFELFWHQGATLLAIYLVCYCYLFSNILIFVIHEYGFL